MTTDPAKQIFQDALDLPAAGRDALLDERCAGQPELRARVVRLLAAHDEADTFMRAPTLTPSDPAQMPIQTTLTSGETIGRFRLESLLGEGGFGRVYLARQREPVTRMVALKVLKPGMDSKAIVARFAAERQALAVMDHPSVARVFDAGQTESGVPYFAMEYVQGEPITTFCDTRGLNVRQRLELFEQVCLAVQHAHHKGIIHRDLKPSNVLITLVDGAPVPKVIDFGIAKAIGPTSGGDTLATVEGQMIGTPAYMSPEQVTGTLGMDTRSDVYTLGVLLYELLTGARPFDDEALRNVPLASLAKIICEESPPRPSTRIMQFPAGTENESGGGPRTTAGHLRGDLDWVVMKAIEKEPSRRYQTAFALAADIRRHLRDEPVEAGPPSGLYRLQKFSRRHRGELLAAGLVLTALIAGLVSSLIFAARVEQESRRTARELEKAEESVAFLSNLLSGLDPAVARGEDRTLLRAMLADADERLDRDPPEFSGVEARMRELLGVAYFMIADFPEAETQLVRSLGLANNALGPDSAEALTIRKQLGEVYIELSRYDDARRELDTAMEGFARTVGPEDPRTISVMFHIGVIDRLIGNFEDARETFQKVLELRTRVLGADHEDTISVQNSYATIADNLGDHETAIAMYREIIEYQLRELGDDHPHTLATQNNLADTLLSVGRGDEAAEILERIIATKRRVLEADHPSLVISLNNVAHAYRQLERYDEAEARLEEAADICARTLGDRDYRTMGIASALAGLKIEKGQHAEAVAMLEPILPMSEEVVGPEHPLTLAILRHLASGHLGAGEPEQATSYARTLVERTGRAVRPEHPAVLAHRRLLAECLLVSGDVQAAELTMQEVVSFTNEFNAESDENRAKTYALMIRVCEAQDRDAEAEEWRSLLREVSQPDQPPPPGG